MRFRDENDKSGIRNGLLCCVVLYCVGKRMAGGQGGDARHYALASHPRRRVRNGELYTKVRRNVLRPKYERPPYFQRKKKHSAKEIASDFATPGATPLVPG